ncbi:eukaryotic translation initiation factor 2A-like [Oscarella lobularis]|uniref:eukaryotic translation initiation factor 2A-like n=1 Tax=Oscarella lobularis TaxID=121494 RepID=UPI00331347B2
MDRFLAVRGSRGLSFASGSQTEPRDDSSHCRVMNFSQDGAFFAWCNGESVAIYDVRLDKLVQKLPKPKAVGLVFSPKSSYLCIWSPYSVGVSASAGACNLCVHRTESGELANEYIHKKFDAWCPQWSDDEVICANNVSNEIRFYSEIGGRVSHKLRIENVATFSLSSGAPPYKVAAYVPGVKGAPSFVRIYQYPNFDSPASALANKSFFKADRVEIKWNQNASGVLVLTSTEVDKTGGSYYGEQGLHFIGTNGESSMVPLAKKGPIYSAEWSPNSKDFCVVYGYMPAKATLYNTKCESIYDFGTGPRNAVHINPHGNIICLAGFGNLRGNLEFWSRKDLKLINKTQASDSTFFQWCPDGEHFVTATTAPRLREGNGYKIWHYLSRQLHVWNSPPKEELWEVSWKPGVFPEKEIRYPTAAELKQQEAAKPAVYRPPNARGKPPRSPFPKEDELPQGAAAAAAAKDEGKQLSKAAAKNKKKREAKLRAREREAEEEKKAVAEKLPSEKAPVSPPPPTEAESGEKDKKLRALKKKLRQVNELKQQQADGKQLQVNQLEKIKTEDDLIEQIRLLEQ